VPPVAVAPTAYIGRTPRGLSGPIRWGDMASLRLGGLGFLLLALGGCSLINAPDEINPSGTGGTGGTGGDGAGAQGGGGAPPCTVDDDCESLTSDCGTGVCGPDMTCTVDPFAVDTPCGPGLGGSCDLEDLCDGAGTCVANNLVDGTFCEDCPAGPGLCSLCSAGTCADCAGRADLKSFRSPLSASGWQLTGGWALYAETPPAISQSFGQPTDECNDGLDNDGDGFTDFPNDPGCSSATDYFEFDLNAQCNDGQDNDGFANAGDGFIDLADPDCEGPGDDTEDYLPPIIFDHPVLGSDGNRQHPYGLAQAQERETSTATSPPTVLPANLEFLSWNLDEGFDFDLKSVEVSADGVSFQVIAVCPQNQMTPYAFCTPVTDRDPDVWDVVSLPVPAEFIGDVGYVRFRYETTDTCCHFERGWYIDALNFAQDCACAGDADCDFLDGPCSTGTCSGTSECNPTAENAGTECSLPSASDGCSAPTCDENGWCASNFLPDEAADCTTCADEGFCDLCLAGACQSCPPTMTSYNNDFSSWVFSGDWGTVSCLEANSVTPSESPCFPFVTNDPAAPMLSPMIGNDGSRTGSFPYVGESEIETSTVVTGPTTIPATLTFNSWHQDRGDDDVFAPKDSKTIRVSTDGGANWSTVVNCSGNTTIPFCQPWPAFTNRALDDWDAISIPIPDPDDELVGQTGIFEFAYDTVDSGQGWERGWYVDDLNINRCDVFRPPWPAVQ